MVVCGAGSELVVRKGASCGVLEIRLGRTNCANCTAPLMLSSPVPCSSMLAPASGCAVYIRIALTMFGVRFGLACSSRAAAPATAGEAIEVPLKYIYFLLSALVTPASRDGFCVTRRLPADSAWIILLPGAAMSGLIRLS